MLKIKHSAFNVNNAVVYVTNIAWMYTQSLSDVEAYLVSLQRLKQYQKYFQAYLDGIVSVGELGCVTVQKEFKRWSSAAEFFSYCFITLANIGLVNISTVTQGRASVEFLDAAATAFVWLPAQRVAAVLPQWAASTEPLHRQIALNALGLRREVFLGDLPALFVHDNPGMRAEACRYSGRMRRFDCIPHLRQSLADEDRHVREQAALALLLCNEAPTALPELFAAVQHYAATAAAGEGSASIRAEARAQHLARVLGHTIPYPCTLEAAAALCRELPPYLALLTLAHHGNPAHVPLLLPYLDSEADGLYKRRALWAMAFMLGINPENEGLLADNPSLSADWPRMPGLDQDTGLPEGEAAKVNLWWQAHEQRYMSMHGPLLSGQPVTALATAKALLSDGMQAQRFAAALHACRLSPQSTWVDTRAPWAMQRRWIESL